MSRTNGVLSILLCLVFQSGICAQQTTGQTGAAEKPRQSAGEQSPASETGPLFLVRKDGKQGYIDKTGKLIIAPRYDRALRFFDGLASVLVGGKRGYIDKTGRLVIAPRYDDTWLFHEGLAAVKVDGKWGYIDKTGKMVIAPQYEGAGPFYQGLAVVTVGGHRQSGRLVGEKQGYIGKTGQIVIRPQYHFAGKFSDGLAGVEVGGKFGYIDTAGKYVWEPTN